ncbi:hypothetical protein F53441_11223 [Fusarium austroafricanum]|uniref:Uncharacterized protein n=1 Tax=Fusarium austroafricanum TaxID=2364996 RepID=A0A8H4NQR4_9HYPO|nr:hypothetical protein F53441_11223 [Fusarium austroafricanum]
MYQRLVAFIRNATTPEESASKLTSVLKLISKDNEGVKETLLSFIATGPPLLRRQAVLQLQKANAGYWVSFFRTVAADVRLLEAQWGGKDWLPADVRASCQARFNNPYPPLFVGKMVRITRAAVLKGINLHSLWADDGPLRKSSRPRDAWYLDDSLYKSVMEEIQNLPTTNEPAGDPYSIPSSIDREIPDSNNELTLRDKPHEVIVIPDEAPDLSDHGDTEPLPEQDLPDQISSETPQEEPPNMMPPPAPETNAVSTKRTHSQMKRSGVSIYDKYKSLVSGLKSEHIARLRTEAIKDLEKAESVKTTADQVLGSVQGMQDQVTTICENSEKYMSTITDQEVIIKLQDFLRQVMPACPDEKITKGLWERNHQALKKLEEAKQRVRTLDHIEKARQIQKAYVAMEDYQHKIRGHAQDIHGMVNAIEEACIEAFSCAEVENWASVLDPGNNGRV